MFITVNNIYYIASIPFGPSPLLEETASVAGVGLVGNDGKDGAVAGKGLDGTLPASDAESEAEDFLLVFFAAGDAAADASRRDGEVMREGGLGGSFRPDGEGIGTFGLEILFFFTVGLLLPAPLLLLAFEALLLLLEFTWRPSQSSRPCQPPPFRMYTDSPLTRTVSLCLVPSFKKRR